MKASTPINSRFGATTRRANITLWTVQGLLALVFLFAGGMKLVMPVAVLAAQSHMSGEFIKFIGVCEVLGGLGLILPGLFHIRTGLTPLAAAGLVIIMTGATLITLVRGPVAGALVPLVVGLLAVSVVRGRWQWSTDSAAFVQAPTVLRKVA